MIDYPPDTPKTNAMLRELELEQLKASEKLNIVVAKTRSLERSSHNAHELIDRLTNITIGGIGEMTIEQARKEYGQWASALLEISRKWKEL